MCTNLLVNGGAHSFELAEDFGLLALEGKLAFHLLVEVSSTAVHDIMLDGLVFFKFGRNEMAELRRGVGAV